MPQPVETGKPQPSEVTITLPYPISSNRYWRKVGGRIVISRAAAEFKKVVAVTARFRGLTKPMLGDVAVSMTLMARQPRRLVPGRGVRVMDLDNALKVTLDSLIGICYVDDSQIVDLKIKRGTPVRGGGVSVTVTAAAQAAGGGDGDT